MTEPMLQRLPSDYEVTGAEAARLCDVKPPIITRAAQNGNLARQPNGKYRVDQVKAWRELTAFYK